MSDIEKAKEHIKNLANDYKCWDNTISFEEALALNEALQNPCKVCDYFAEDDISYCRKSENPLVIKCNRMLPTEELERIRKIIREQALDEVVVLPTGFELARKMGHWRRISPAKIYECSECGQNVMTDNIDCYKFCHCCGAKMKGD